MQELEQENKDMDEDGEEFVAQKRHECGQLNCEAPCFVCKFMQQTLGAPDQDKLNRS